MPYKRALVQYPELEERTRSYWALSSDSELHKFHINITKREKDVFPAQAHVDLGP
jgi:hypothetical protein